ncbi:MAG: hypothetical protein ACXV5H_04795 [Halobacteriota archaeon]
MEAHSDISEPTNLQQCEYVFRNPGAIIVFKKGSGERCREPTYANGKCILHADFRSDSGDDINTELAAKKSAKISEKIKNGDFNFEGAVLRSLLLSNFPELKEVNGELKFRDAMIFGNVELNGINTNGSVFFDGATIKGVASLDNVIINGAVFFTKGSISAYASLKDARISEGVWFTCANVGAPIEENNGYLGSPEYGCVMLNGATIGGPADFYRADIMGIMDASKSSDHKSTEIKEGLNLTLARTGAVSSDGAVIRLSLSLSGTSTDGVLRFDNAIITASTFTCEGAKAYMGLTFHNTRFAHPDVEARACRHAKQIASGLGDRDDADYYFYREMAAKRQQKRPNLSFVEAYHNSREKGGTWVKDVDDVRHLDETRLNTYVRDYIQYYLEWPIQYITGYWVYPTRVLGAFAVFVLLFGFLFTIIRQDFTAAGLGDGIWDSFLTLFNPIGKIENAQVGALGTVTIIAGFIGLFTWPVFIATLAKKYGR